MTTTLPRDPSFPSSHQLLIFLQLVMGTHDPSPIHAGLLTGLISCRPCADSHSRCEILSAAATSYLEDSMLPLSSSSCILSTSSCVMFPSHGWGSIYRSHLELTAIVIGKEGTLMYLGNWNRGRQPGSLSNNSYCLTLLEAGSPRWRCWYSSGLTYTQE